MFEIAWSELLLVLVVAIIFVGPKELPGMLRTFGRMMGKLRRAADDFRRQFDESVREAGGEDLQRELAELRRNNPLNEIRNTIEEAARQAEAGPKPLPAPQWSPAPEASIDNPAEPPVTHETYTPQVTDAPAPPNPAQGDGAPPASAEPAHPAKEASPSPGHEPLVNGQHRPLS